MKICSKCGLEKENFRKGKNQCYDCEKYRNNNYYKNNKDVYKKNYENNKENIQKYNIEYNKIYYINHKNHFNEYSKKWYEDNKEYHNQYSKEYRKNNREAIKKYKEYNIANINEYRREYYKNRIETDPVFKLRAMMSSSIWKILKSNNGSKRGQSILKFLPYSIEELKQHIESQFEPWMNWNNQGIYNTDNWNDNDSSTWTWQIDHIIPHSTFKYSSMEDEEFKKCWALDNLRPLSAKQNHYDGIHRIRHKK